ncbi:MAG: FMN-binding protein [Schwartzia sp.]|nr:FMN-binding protein [Schwartzia sp. (in: firmicutes)]
MKKILAAAMAACALFSAGCGGDSKPAPKAEQKQAQETKQPVDSLSAAKDGTYTAESRADEWGKGRLTIVVKDHKITAAEFLGVKPDGKIKDENYGKGENGEIKNEGKYKKAQNALKAHENYAAQLVERQKPSDVDAIAGATVSYNQFVEAAHNAIEQSKK